MKEQNSKHKFEWNSKYFTISVYTFIVVVLSTLFIKAVFSWGTTKNMMEELLSTISPFIIGLFLAFIMNALVKTIDHYIFSKIFRIKNAKARKYLSILFGYLLLVGLFVLIFVYLIPQIVNSIADLVNSIQAFTPKFIDYVNHFDKHYPNVDLTTLNKVVSNLIPTLTKILQNFMAGLATGIFSAGRSVISWSLKILIALIVSIYMILDKRILYQGLKRITYAFLPERKASSLATTLKNSCNIFMNFVIGKTIDSLIIGVICFIVMSILKLDYALLISLIVGITNMIPYFGPFIGAIPGALILLIVSPKEMLIFIVWIIILQQFDGLYLGPKILGNSTGLRPLWIIFAITFGGYLAGPVGMFLGVPCIAVIGYLVGNVVDRRLKKKNLSIPDKK